MTYEEKLAEVFRAGQKSLIDFRRVILQNDDETEVESADFHKRWSDILLEGSKNFAVEAFRESGKSQYVIRAFPLYALVFPDKSRNYIVFVKKNARLASNKLKEISKEAKENPFISSRIIKINEESAEAFDVTVKDYNNNPFHVRIEAYGKGASIRGLSNLDERPKIVIIDDPQDLKDALSETVQETDWRWFLSDIKFLGKKCRIFMIGNNLGAKCIIERVFEHPEELNCETERIPIYDETTGKATWGEMFPVEEVLKEKDSYRTLGQLEIWYRERMCQAISDETRKFRKQDFRYYTARDAKSIAENCNIYIRTDLIPPPNESNFERGDNAVIECFGIDEDDCWWIFDVFYGRVDPSEFIKILFQMVRQWKPLNVGFPKVAFEASMEHFVLKHQKETKTYFNTFGQVQETKKELRIMQALQPRIRLHKIYFPDDAWWLTQLETELLMFPKGKNDDIIDTMANNDQESSTPLGRKRHETLPRRAKADLGLRR